MEEKFTQQQLTEALSILMALGVTDGVKSDPALRESLIRAASIIGFSLDIPANNIVSTLNNLIE